MTDEQMKEELLLKNYELDKYRDEIIKKAKAEAIKEFADQLKKCLHTDDFGTPDECWKPESDFAYIVDYLAKGMTEGEGGNE